MKKVTKSVSKPGKAGASAKKRQKQVNPILAMLQDMDEDVVALLRQSIRNELGPGLNLSGPDDPVKLFADYLEDCADETVDEDENNEKLVELVDVLSQARIDANGGDRQARKNIKEIYDLLEGAIGRGAIKPIDLMMIGKVLADAGWAVPESLRQALGDAVMEAGPAEETDGDMKVLVSSLVEMAEATGLNPFGVHEQLNSLAAGLPSQVGAALVAGLIAEGTSAVAQACAGFALHPDAVLARAALAGLSAAAARAPVESLLIERLVRMRPWLPEDRLAPLDAAIRALRANALPPVETPTPKLLKCYVSVCDGSGTRSLFAAQKAGSAWQVASVMMKTSGVADAMVIADLRKSQMDDIIRQMKASTPATETDLAGAARMLGLAVADNLAGGAPPPYMLIQVAESLGFGPIYPECARPQDILAGLLAELPAEQTDSAAAAKAHAAIRDSEFADHWFEAGEALEDVIRPVKGFNRRVAKVLESYLPGRREFWARQCALSALALRGDAKTSLALWRQLALVGRDIASDIPLDRMPLMNCVAELSVRAFEGQGGR